MLDTLPGTRFLYNPPDTMLLMRAVREAVKDDKTFWAMPFQQLFWKIGMTRTTPASDWNGDFLMSGQTYSSARDFARFGLLYLNDGVWNGERILPEGWTKFVATPDPVQPADNGPRYGGQFWIYSGLDGCSPTALTRPNGGQGQYAMIIPSHKAVIVRRGFDFGPRLQDRQVLSRRTPRHRLGTGGCGWSFSRGRACPLEARKEVSSDPTGRGNPCEAF